METIVLKQGEAIAWIKREASNIIDDYTNGNYDSEETGDIVADLLSNIDAIQKNNWEWVAIEECAMAVSNINVCEMKKA